MSQQKNENAKLNFKYCLHQICGVTLLLGPETQPSSILCVPTIYNTTRHFNRLFSLWDRIQLLSKEHLDITIDFQNCDFLGHNGVAFLGGLAHFIQDRGGRVTFKWETLSTKISINLAQNGFLSNFGYNWGPWNGNSIPYRRDISHDKIAIGRYLQENWLGKGWVNISSGLQKAITDTVSEIYVNAFEHSCSNIGVFSCGQHYPKAGLLELTVIDFGIGIPTSVRSLPQNVNMTTSETFAWAFQPGTSTKQSGVARGVGLNLLKDYMVKNRGNFMIFSNDGCVIIDDNGIRCENICTSFGGTLVNIAFRCDESYYCLASEAPQLKKPLF